ncbi:MAG: tyrosine-type recombinase/integrase [Clostridium perfringens]|nr:tyrosine-type recombinase/integrase [Clostridium perfringens]MDU3020385.1 tyrosine-type recombinase/integrase [Clostridium perfringens]
MSKKKNRNINGQITYAINKCFKEGIDKRAYKIKAGRAMGDKVFSYAEKYRLKDMAKSLQKFLKDNGRDVKYVKDIQSEDIQGYLESEKARGCTQNTIDTYANSLFKIQEAINATYGVRTNWRSEISMPVAEKAHSVDRGVNSVITREDYNKILDYAAKNRSESGYAVRLQDFLGVRVEEVARISRDNINLEDRTIKLVNTKGGRELTRDIPNDRVELVKEVLEHNYHEDRLFSIKGDSINRYLNRIEDKLRIERHSNHDIRRLIAQEKFDGYRKSGLSIKDAANKTSAWLSHGDNRNELLEKSYINLK